MDETPANSGPTEGSGVATEGSLPHPPHARVLRRRADQRILGGVAGGLGDYFDVTPIGFRLAFAGCGFMVVFLTYRTWTGFPAVSYYYHPYAGPLKLLIKMFAGVGLFGYLALWLVVPREDRPDSAAGRMMRHFPGVVSLIGGVLLLVGVGLFGAAIGLWPPDVIWAFLLIGLGVVVFRRDAKRANGGASGASSMLSETRAMIEPVVRVPRAKRERSPLGWLTLGAALLAFGVASALGGAGAVHLRLVQYPAVGLLALGIGLLIGAVWGRARWLILLGVLAIPVVLTASVVQVPLQGGFHRVSVVARTRSDLSPAYHTMIGNVYLDLSHLDLGGATVHLEATTALGTIQVTVPAHARVEVTGDVGGGSVWIGRSSNDGLDLVFHRTLVPDGRVSGMIVLHLRAGIGDVSVSRFERYVPPKHHKDNANQNTNGKGNNN